MTVEERLAYLEARVATLEAQLRLTQPYQPMMPQPAQWPVLSWQITCESQQAVTTEAARLFNTINAAFAEAANRG